MTHDQQEKFQSYLRDRMKHPSPLYLLSFKQLAEEALGRKIGHWRSLSQLDARQVMRHVERRAQDIAPSEAATPDRVAASKPEVPANDRITMPYLIKVP